jgi:primosomal protein N' (replication factor Y)
MSDHAASYVYAEIALTSANQGGAHHTYHYIVPDDLRFDGIGVAVGHLVEVSFGTARAAGVVIALSDASPVVRAKPILSRLDPDPVVSPLQLELAYWLSETTLTPLGLCLALLIPAGIARSGDKLYTLIDSDLVTHDMGEIAAQIIVLLHDRGALRGAQIDRALPKTNWRQALAKFIESGQVTREPILNAPTVAAKHARTVQLAIAPDQVEPTIAAFKRAANSGRARILRFLATQTAAIESAELLSQTQSDSGALKRLFDAGLVAYGEADAWRDPLRGREFVAADPLTLTPDQAAAWNAIQPAIVGRQPEVFLLHGVTGSGKTEVYLRAIAETIAQGRQAIALVPEIALVPQTVRRFTARFPQRVALVHSELSPGEQFDTWRRAQLGAFDLVIGARSALFTPLPDVGVIILDEEHDTSYKQTPPIPPPYYHARDVAIAMGRLFNCPVILGSATPDLVTRWQADQGHIRYVHLPDRVLAHRTRVEEQAKQLHESTERFLPTETRDALYLPLPAVTVVDMRAELHAGNRSIFSHELRVALTETLKRGEQALLYLNRRGTATVVMCRDCGYVARCPRCDTPLTYHDSEVMLTCHGCNYRSEPPAKCPDCGSTRIRYFGLGTAKLEETVVQEFPEARIARWDRDTVREHGAHEAILSHFITGDANVLIGTQMIAKGLDLPRVTLVGIVLADTTLGLPDYRAGERAFQLLTQVSGRAGRSWRGGRAILQTYQPDHYAVQAAAGHDYTTFYARELGYRHALGYPPFTRLARLLFKDPSLDKVQSAAERAAKHLHSIISRERLSAQIVGPVPAFFAKSADIYRWQILVKSADPVAVMRHFEVPPGAYLDIDPVDIL